MVGTVDLPAVGRVESIQLSSPPRSGQLSRGSPRTIAFEDLGDSSVPVSPNRFQAARSQEVPEDGSLFNMSPVSPGFLMRPSGAAGQHPEAGLPLPSALDSFSDSVFGDPIAFAQCAQIPGLDTPLELPVYTLPSGLAYMLGQSSVQTVLASGASLGRRGGPPIRPRLRTLLGRGHLTLSLLQWIRRTAIWSRRDCRAVRIGLRLITGRQSLI